MRGRATSSPRWAASNAHLDDWGEFGMGWQQLNTWVRMASPDTAIFDRAGDAVVSGNQWPGERRGGLGEYPERRKDFDQYKGKLAGKIVLLGEMRPVRRCPTSRLHALHRQRAGRHGERRGRRWPASPNSPEYQARIEGATCSGWRCADKIPQFLADEKALAVIRPAATARTAAAPASFSTTTARRLGASLIRARARSRFPASWRRSRAAGASTGCCRRMSR